MINRHKLQTSKFLMQFTRRNIIHREGDNYTNSSAVICLTDLIISPATGSCRWLLSHTHRDGKIGFQIGSDWPKMGQIWDFLRSGAPKCTETDLKKSQICPILGQSDTIWMENLTSLHQTCRQTDRSIDTLSLLHHSVCASIRQVVTGLQTGENTANQTHLYLFNIFRSLHLIWLNYCH